jgi:sugar diacid utilization regulator
MLLAETQAILDDALEALWKGAAATRQVACVTLLRELADAEQCRNGELVVLQPGGSGAHGLRELIQVLAGRHVAGLLAPADLPAPTLAWLRAVGADGDMPIGLLHRCTDPQTIANRLNRALADARPALPLAPMAGSDPLQALAETVGHLVGNSVTIESPRHDLLAFSAMRGAVDRVREETILLRRGAARALAWAIREGHVSAICKADHPVRVPPNPALDFSGRLAMRVAVDDEVLAIIWVTDSARPLQPRDEAVIVQAAQTAAAILIQRRAAVQKEAELHTEILEDLVQGRISGLENVRSLARGLGWDLDRLQHVLVVRIDHLEALRLRHAGQHGWRLQRVRERITEAVRLEVLAVDALAIIGPRSSGVIVLCSTGHSEEGRRKAAAMRLAERIVKRVAALAPEVSVTVGVGRDMARVEDLPESFHQAELAAHLGGSLWGGNRATHHADLGVYRVLFTLREQGEMIAPPLQRLIDHDSTHHTEYVRTLTSYLACMGRLRSAAARLAIHRNTLEYRMQRIGEIAGVQLDDPNDRLTLELGIRLLELRTATESC